MMNLSEYEKLFIEQQNYEQLVSQVPRCMGLQEYVEILTFHDGTLNYRYPYLLVINKTYFWGKITPLCYEDPGKRFVDVWTYKNQEFKSFLNTDLQKFDTYSRYLKKYESMLIIAWFESRDIDRAFQTAINIYNYKPKFSTWRKNDSPSSISEFISPIDYLKFHGEHRINSLKGSAINVPT